jgi:oxaloacetate decarboxylase
LRNGTKPKAITNLPTAELMKLVTRDADYGRWTKEFLGG